MLGPFCKLLHGPSLPSAGECPPAFFYFLFQSAGSRLHLPPAVASDRPERSGGLLNMRPLGAPSSPSAGVAETLTAKGETGILPPQWAFTRRHVTFRGIQSSKTWPFIPSADRGGQRRGEELRACMIDSSVFYNADVDPSACWSLCKWCNFKSEKWFKTGS